MQGSGTVAINDYTRRHFAEVLQEMLRTQDLESVRINDLCRKCGAQRGTFYYYFRDKYDLVSWIFMQDLELSDMNSESPYSVSQLAQSLARMWNKRNFYIRAFHDRSQNTLFEYIQDYDVQYLEQLVRRSLEGAKLTEEQRFVIKYHSYGCLGYTIEWLKGKLPVTAEELASYEFRTMPKLIRDAYTYNG